MENIISKLKPNLKIIKSLLNNDSEKSLSNKEDKEDKEERAETTKTEYNNNEDSSSEDSEDSSSEDSEDSSSEDSEDSSSEDSDNDNDEENDNPISENQENANSSISSKYPYLYPELTDPNFNRKIAEKKEFNDTRYDGTIYKVNEQAEKLCNAEFELLPHQQFVRNFLSFQTPYNSLLLYHGLGSGKTCSAIGIAEEMRDYNNQIGTLQKIIIIASPNVQENFRLQLFDESKLKLVDGLWNIKSCTGNKFLREINPMNMKGLSKEKIISQIKTINKYSI